MDGCINYLYLVGFLVITLLHIFREFVSKQIKNRLTFDVVTAMSLVSPNLWDTVYNYRKMQTVSAPVRLARFDACAWPYSAYQRTKQIQISLLCKQTSGWIH